MPVSHISILATLPSWQDAARMSPICTRKVNMPHTDVEDGSFFYHDCDGVLSPYFNFSLIPSIVESPLAALTPVASGTECVGPWNSSLLIHTPPSFLLRFITYLLLEDPRALIKGKCDDVTSSPTNKSCSESKASSATVPQPFLHLSDLINLWLPLLMIKPVLFLIMISSNSTLDDSASPHLFPLTSSCGT